MTTLLGTWHIPWKTAILSRWFSNFQRVDMWSFPGKMAQWDLTPLNGLANANTLYIYICIYTYTVYIYIPWVVVSNIFGILTPTLLGDDFPILTNIFQLGWNHQLVPYFWPTFCGPFGTIFLFKHLSSWRHGLASFFLLNFQWCFFNQDSNCCLSQDTLLLNDFLEVEKWAMTQPGFTDIYIPEKSTIHVLANIPVPQGMTMDEHGWLHNQPVGSAKPTEPWIHLEE